MANPTPSALDLSSSNGPQLGIQRNPSSSSKTSRSLLQKRRRHTSRPSLHQFPTRPVSGLQGGESYMTRMPSEDNRALAAPVTPGSPSTSTPSSTLRGVPMKLTRGSMILYRFEEERPQIPKSIAPASDGVAGVHRRYNSMPTLNLNPRTSLSISSDSRYPLSGAHFREHGPLVAYAWDPGLDDELFIDDEDDEKETARFGAGGVSWRGTANVFTLTLLMVGIMGLFVAYPVVTHYTDNGREMAITMNAKINSTGQAVE
ncbi:hypothetical protein BDQ12DRAFT_138181 [Crucibulum laeve]|uniref:Uncharacterized protein n=1 Tax=Crucibulum laeve TaxID=68775 RepID=A0A5C3M0Q8_9AGAR|nr:hypothetical protein BDQ12DRAFT_138181 [Crucibulum laeve]